MAVLTLNGLFPWYHGDVCRVVSSRYCVIILSIMAAMHLIFVSLHYRKPIDCFCPAHFEDTHSAYVHTACLKQVMSYKDVYLPLPEDLPHNQATPVRLGLGPFYQYMSALLLLQAAMFFLPTVLWLEAARCLGLDTDELSLVAVEARRSREVGERAGSVEHLATHLHIYCMRQVRQRRESIVGWWLYGSRFVLLQVFFKSLYFANVIVQFYLLDHMLAINFHDIGWPIMGRHPASSISQALSNHMLQLLEAFGTISNLLPKNETTFDEVADTLDTDTILEIMEQDQFPSIFLCDVPIRNLGNIHRYSFQCVLPLNDLNQLVLQYDWFLLLSAATVTFCALLIATIKLFTYPCRRGVIRTRLSDSGKKLATRPTSTGDDPEVTPQQAATENDNNDAAPSSEIDTEEYLRIQNARNREYDRFERDFLCMDGILLLEFVEAGGGDVVSDSTLARLWEMYQEEEELEELFKPVQRQERIVEEKVVEDINSSPNMLTDRREDTQLAERLRGDTHPDSMERPPDYSDVFSTGTRDKSKLEDDSMV